MEKNKSFNELVENINQNNSELENIFNEAKAERKKRSRIALLICGIIDCAAILLILKNTNAAHSSFRYVMPHFPVIFGLLIVNIIISSIAVAGKNQRKYSKAYKECVIPKLIQNFYNNAEYYPNKGMPKGIYIEANYNESMDRYYSDDYIEATMDGKYLMDMAEVHTQREEQTQDSDGHTHTTYVTEFHGIFAKIINEKSINSILRITTRLW